MKRLVGLALILGSTSAFAGDPVWLQSYSDSSYTVSHSTVAITSYTVTTIAAASRWREVYVGNPATTAVIYYRIDGSTANIPTVGSWIEAAKEKRIESNAAVNMQLGATVAATTARITELKRIP